MEGVSDADLLLALDFEDDEEPAAVVTPAAPAGICAPDNSRTTSSRVPTLPGLPAVPRVGTLTQKAATITVVRAGAPASSQSAAAMSKTAVGVSRTSAPASAATPASSSSNDEHVEPFSGLAIRSRRVASMDIRLALSGRTFHKLDVLASSSQKILTVSTASNPKGGAARGTECSWHTIGVVAETALRQPAAREDEDGGRASTSTFLRWVVTDYNVTIQVLVFAAAVAALKDVPVGSIVLINNPTMLPARERNRFTLSVSDASQAVVLGVSPVFGMCRASRKSDSNRCTNAVDTSRSQYCVYHMQREYTTMLKEASTSRGEIMGIAPRIIMSDGHGGVTLPSSTGMRNISAGRYDATAVHAAKRSIVKRPSAPAATSSLLPPMAYCLDMDGYGYTGAAPADAGDAHAAAARSLNQRSSAHVMEKLASSGSAAQQRERAAVVASASAVVKHVAASKQRNNASAASATQRELAALGALFSGAAQAGDDDIPRGRKRPAFVVGSDGELHVPPPLTTGNATDVDKRAEEVAASVATERLRGTVQQVLDGGRSHGAPSISRSSRGLSAVATVAGVPLPPRAVQTDPLAYRIAISNHQSSAPAQQHARPAPVAPPSRPHMQSAALERHLAAQASVQAFSTAQSVLSGSHARACGLPSSASLGGVRRCDAPLSNEDSMADIVDNTRARLRELGTQMHADPLGSMLPTMDVDDSGQLAAIAGNKRRASTDAGTTDARKRSRPPAAAPVMFIDRHAKQVMEEQTSLRAEVAAALHHNSTKSLPASMGSVAAGVRALAPHSAAGINSLSSGGGKRVVAAKPSSLAAALGMGGIDIHSEAAIRAIQTRSAHVDDGDAQLRAELEKRLDRGIQLDKMEEGMKRVTHRPMLFHHCQQCESWTRAASALCVREGHDVQPVERVMHAVKCANCKHRTWAETLPYVHPCSRCSKATWESTSIYKLREGIETLPENVVKVTGEAVEDSLRYGGLVK